MSVRSILWTMMGIFTAALGGMRCYVRPVIVEGDSMAPTLHNWQIVWMHCRRADDAPLAPGDVVVFQHNGETLIKRVAATGGDTMKLYRILCGEPSPMPPGQSGHMIRRFLRRCPSKGTVIPLRVPEGTVYVLGDNGSASVDSRELGPIPLREVCGVIPGVPGPPEPPTLPVRTASLPPPRHR